MPRNTKSRLGVHPVPDKSGAQFVQAASIKCLVFVAPLGVEHNTETDDMRAGLYPAVPAPGSAIDFRETHGDVVAVTGVNYTPGSATVTILGTTMSISPEEARDLGVAASFEYGTGETVEVPDGSGDEVRVDRRGLDDLIASAASLTGTVDPDAPAADVDALPHDNAPEANPLGEPAE